MTSHRITTRFLIAFVAGILALAAPLFAEVTAVDDGSAGTPFLTTLADTPALGGDVTANDTGTSPAVVAGSITTTEGGTVILSANGTFLFTPGGAAVRELDSGGSLEDTFDYMLSVPLTAGVTSELNATSGVNTGVWNGLSATVAASGAGLPAAITSAFPMPAGGTRGSYNGAGDTEPASFEFWIRPDSITTDQVLFESGGTGTGGAIVINDDATVSAVIRGGGSGPLIVQSTATLTVGQWYHVMVTFDLGAAAATDTLTLYIDGAADGSATKTDANDWSGTDGAGLGTNNGSTAADNTNVDGDGTNETYGDFTGQMGVFRFYRNKVLSASEVFDNYCNATAIDTATVTVQVDGVDDAPQALDDVLAGPLATATLASTADLTANDGSTRAAPPANRDTLILNYDANLATGSSTWVNHGPYGGSALDWNLLAGVTLNTSPTTSVPTIRQAFTFDGTANARGTYGTGTSNDAIHELLTAAVVPFGKTDTTDTTFEFWAKPANTSSVMTLFETGGGTGFGFIINNGVLEAASELDGGTMNGSYVSYDLVADSLGLIKGDPTTDFNHYAAALRVGGGGISLYVNGVLVDNTTAGTGADWDGGDSSGLGRFAGSNHGGFSNGSSGGTYDAPFNGEMASFRLYGAALSANQVKRNYEAATNLVLLEWDARSVGTSNDLWPNTGSLGGTNLDWKLGSGVTLNASPGSTRGQIDAAYEFDGTADAAGVFTSVLNGDSFDTLIGAALDQEDATFEAWIKLDAADLTQVSSVFETGGTTGFGVVVDNGVLQAATEDDGFFGTGSTVSYNLNTDPDTVLDAGLTAEFIHVAVAIDVGTGLTLYVNGTRVDSTTSGAGTDWSGADGAGLGRWADASHGGFAADPVADGYDNSFNGSIALVRFYGTALDGGDILQNFTGVANDTDVEGNAITVSGIFDETDGSLKIVTETATLDSGATVILDSATGSFTYDPNGAFDDLVADATAIDTFTYQVTSASGTGSAEVHLTISGVNAAANDTIEATETLVTNYTANQVVGNDEHALGTSDAFLNLDANNVTPADITAGIWRNSGTGGSTYDVTMTGGTLIAPPTLESNFGAVGQSWQNPVGTFTSFQAISDRDATVEIWFQPTPLTTGRQLLMESGGSVNGMSIVYNADTAEVDFIIDSGTDGTNTIQVSATGIVPGEFNQLIAVYDKDSPTVEDTLTLYLNGDPTAFSAVPNATATNTGGTTDNFSGSNGSGIGAVNSSEALEGSFGLPGFPATASAPFQGQISIVRVYPRKLSATEFEANFDAIVQKIDSFTGSAPTPGPASTITTTLGATVTLNADRSFTYDSTGLADIPEGNVVMDSFDYTTGDGAGGTTTTTVTVNVTGVGSFLALDDNFGVNESDGPTGFDPVANDSGADAVVVELQSTVANFATSIVTGTLDGETADFLDGMGHGWQYLWNAPTGWTQGGSFDGTTGALGSIADYKLLVWDSAIPTGVGGWLVDADGLEFDATSEPGSYLRISPDGTGINGGGSTQDLGVGNTQDRCLILAYTVESDGYYVIDESTITLGGGTGITVETAVGSTAKTSTAIAGGTSGSFDENLGFVSADDTIYIAICPDGDRVTDFFSGLDFTLVRLPSADSQVDNILGTVSTDGSLITYDPGSAFDGLAAGQTVDETITYTIRDLTSTLDYDTGTVLFTAGQSLTGPTGSATIVSVNGDATSGTLRLKDITGTFADNDALTGGGGGAALANGTPIASTSVSTADFTVTVTGENDAPTAVDDPLAATADEDTGVTGALSVLLNDTDPDQGDALTLVVSEVQSTAVSGATVVATDKGGSLTMNPDGTFDYDPSGLFEALAVGETDTDTFTYLCADSGGLPSAATATATITINGANDGVTATANAYAVDVDSVATGNVITDDTGAGLDSTIDTNDTLTVSGVDTSATVGSVSVQSDGSFTYDPGCAFDGLAPGATGMDTFVYTLSDGQGETDPATVTVTATGVNRPAGVQDPATLTQVVIGTGTQALGDIVVADPDANRALVDTTATALFEFRNGVSVFSDARADSDDTFDLDGDPGGSVLTDADGMSLDMTFVAQAADLSGTVVLFDIGGSSNGSSIHLVDGIPHLLSKATSTAALAPTDDSGADNVFRDLDWATDSAVVVPLSSVQVTPGVSTKLAVVFDISNDTVEYSVNNAPAQTATLLNNDSVDYNGDHSVSIGIDGGGIGGETTFAGSPFLNTGFVDLAGGSAAVSCMRFWSESTGSVGIDLGESVTATLTIQSWNGSDSISGLTDQGGGVFDVSGDAATVSAALAAMEFVPGGTTTYPVTIDFSLDDGDEDGSGAVTGTIYIDDGLPATVYVDDDFSGAFLSMIADADNGTPSDSAILGYNAFTNLTDAAAAVDPAGTIVVNDGDYSGETLALTGTTTLRLTDAGESVAIGGLDAAATNTLNIQDSNLTLGGAGTNTIIDCPISGTSGTLTKAGGGDVRLRGASTFMGVTTINDGRIVITYIDPSNRGSLASTGIVVNSPAILALGAAVDTSYSHTNPISGTGSVSTFEDGTVEFNTPGGNSFSGEFNLGDGASSVFDGVIGAKEGFVVVNESNDLGTGKILSRGGQLQAGTTGIVIANDIDITSGGFRNGGANDFEFSGNIATIDGAPRGFGNYGLEGLDLTISGNVTNSSASPIWFEGSPGKDNGTWTVSGDISGPDALAVQTGFDDGMVTLSGTNTYTGDTGVEAGTLILDATHTGGGAYTVDSGATLAGSGSTDSAVTVNAGGTIAAGTSPGSLSTGDLTVAGTIAVEINDVITPGVDFGQILVTGLVDLTGADIAVSGSNTVVGTITVIDNDLADAVTGTPTASGMTTGTEPSVVDIAGGDGNDVDLLLTSLATIYDIWAMGEGLTGPEAAPDADVENSPTSGDSVINLVEFAFNTNPNVYDDAPLTVDTGGGTFTAGQPVFVDDGGGLMFRYVEPTFAGITVTPEFSVDGNPFSASTDTPTEVIADPGTGPNAGYRVVEVPAPANPSALGRVEVEILP